MGIIRSAIVQWVMNNGGKISKSNNSVDYFIPVGRIDAFFVYLRECLSQGLEYVLLQTSGWVHNCTKAFNRTEYRILKLGHTNYR